MGTSNVIQADVRRVSPTADTRADILRAYWKSDVKRWPPSRRWAWLKSKDGITALGAKTANNLAREIESRGGEVMAAVCSSNWCDAWLADGVLPPELKFESDGRIIQLDTRGEDLAAVRARLERTAEQKLSRGGLASTERRRVLAAVARAFDAIEHAGRRYSVRLVRSRGLVRNGESRGAPSDLPTAGAGSSRWTPPQAVAWEDETDVMDVKAADRFIFPASCSAEAIRRIGFMRGREVSEKPKRVKKKKGGKVVEIVENEHAPSSDRIVELSQGGGVNTAELTLDSLELIVDRTVRTHGKETPRSTSSARPR